ncbi:LysR family glycine cleavage system transcriptional activator [Humitalea rosea]|uniref:LysR family glycine cleavage system transcriptional activator n=1 Tax=Humitalea rosea TaxID=990373 RepID=A0A2W7I624_9PROT|nr:LysR substrate-binding domain-containing protein [Humitalea rosea]PZW42114.1 LysR family glycine cleavage system transcriptional activator [Humitalea rosea]
MSRLIPPLNPLFFFEVASRQGSFTRAAEELNVTQSAVSRQIAVLERFVGAKLFRRERHGIVLTEAGESYRREIAPAFERIHRATAQMRQAEQDEPLRVRVYSTFAVKWLFARLPEFNARHPEIELSLSNTVAPVDFKRDEIDLAIQFGSGDWPGMEVRELLPDVIQPVCSPRLLHRQKIESLDDLAKHRLLVSHYRRLDWKDWLGAAGRCDLLQPGMEFPSSVLTYQAAIDGLGIAVGQMRLLDQDVRAGLLVPLFTPVTRALAHYIVWPADRTPNRKGRLFLAWLQQATREAA